MAAVTVLQHHTSEADASPTIYRYVESGLENVWLVGGVSFDEDDGETCLFVEDREDLHKLISLSIIHRGDRISGRELRFLRHELELTQDHLARLLETDVQSVARWEKGKSRPPGPADRLIRSLYLLRYERNPNVMAFLEELTQLDRLTAGKQVFERRAREWRAAA